MYLRILICCAVLGLIGCASNADSVAPSYVSPIGYEGLSCRKLSMEAKRVGAEAAKLAGVQDKNATNDAVLTAVGVVVFWPVLFFTEGDGQTAAQLAQMKGRMKVIEEVSNRKKCGIKFQSAKPKPEMS